MSQIRIPSNISPLGGIRPVRFSYDVAKSFFDFSEEINLKLKPIDIGQFNEKSYPYNVLRGNGFFGFGGSNINYYVAYSLGFDEFGLPIERGIVTRDVENPQRLEIRKNLEVDLGISGNRKDFALRILKSINGKPTREIPVNQFSFVTYQDIDRHRITQLLRNLFYNY